MSLKRFSSRSGRWLSIGMQYLKIYASLVIVVNTKQPEPYRMQSGLQSACTSLALNEFFQNDYFLCPTALDASGIMKNISRMVREHKFIIDIVLATLTQS